MNVKRFGLLMLLLVVTTVVPLVNAQGSSLTIAWPQEPDSLNPMYTTMTYGNYTISLFYASPWVFNSTLEPVPVLLTEMPSSENGGISEDGTTFTLRLKEGMTWSDGEALDSADFLFTYEMYMAETNSPISRGAYELMASYETPDPLTVVITFPEPYSPWLGMLSAILPEHIFRPVFDENGTLDGSELDRAPAVSSGPYLFTEWNTGNFISAAANPNYVMGAPKIETMIVRFIADEEPYVQSLISGEIAIATFFSFSSAPQIEQAGIEVQLLPSGYNEGWYFNQGPDGHPALQDVNVRKAVVLAFDRDAINSDLNYNATYTGTSIWEGTPYANPDLEPYPFDPEMAAQLLDEAGWVDSNGDGTRDKDGVELVLRFVTNQRQIRLDIAAIVQQQLGEVGIGVELINYPSDQFFGGFAEGGPVSTGQYDIAQWSSAPGGFPDPNTRAMLC
jgi:peptide/nickel transport system substrate-binding protein